MIYLFLADGFEITEAMGPLDVLRRAKFDVKTVGLYSNSIKSSCGVEIKTDIKVDEIVLNNELEAIILPGGMPGTLNLEASKEVQNCIDYCYKNNILICAICAAPSILGHKNLLSDKFAVCYPGFEKDLYGSKPSSLSVVSDGQFITAKGAGVSIDFGLKIIECLSSIELSNEIKDAIQCPQKMN